MTTSANANENTNIHELDSSALDTIAGGNNAEMAADSQILYRMGLLSRTYDEDDCEWGRDDAIENMSDAWIDCLEKTGVCCRQFSDAHNIYSYLGKRITREEAYARLEKYMAKHKK